MSTAAPLAARPVVVGGRTYVPVDNQALTFEHEIYISSQCHAAGLGEIAEAIATAGRPLDELCLEIVGRVAESGRLFQVLAGAYVLEGTRWTPPAAAETALAFASATEPDSKRSLFDALAAVVLGFFVTAAGSSGISLSSLTVDESQGAGAGRGGIGDPSTSGTSPT